MGVSGKEKDRHDYYFKKARAEHYRARSVYKLQEIQDQLKVLRRGATVVDLGAAPGSWTQYAAEVVGPAGRVVAIDRTPIEAGLPKQVTTLTMDLLEVSPEALRDQAGVTRVDAVISDMAPNTSGIRGVDHARSVELCRKAMQVADLILSPGGSFVCKIFQGEEVQAFAAELKPRFAQVKTVKPKSSRDESVEIFLVGKGFAGPLEAAEGTAEKRGGWDPLADG
jgi:23S rRNA (uridine2552-2'-O)-methyltransferase